MKPPQIRYARSGDLHIAYRIDGEGLPDVVVVGDWMTDVEATPELPVWDQWFQRVASFARVVSFDQPGTGHSDPVPPRELPTLEDFADSIRVVMDDASIDRAALIAWGWSTAAAVMFAATHPQRTSALVIQSGTARTRADEGYPGVAEELVDQFVEGFTTAWGTPLILSAFPSAAFDAAAGEAWARTSRQNVSPGMIRALIRMMVRLDVRGLLPSVTCPTLVLHTNASAFPMVEHGRYLAAHIPKATFALYESRDLIPTHYTKSQFEGWMGDIEEFLTGERHTPANDDRSLATVLFTDIICSTERAAELGDRLWRDILRRHDAVSSHAVDRFGGRVVKSTGDGILATFDGPARAVRCACELKAAIQKMGLEIRAGLHTGEIEMVGQDVHGIAIHIGQRVSALAGSGEILVSRTVTDLVSGSGLEFDDRGEHELKGVPGRWQLYAVRA